MKLWLSCKHEAPETHTWVKSVEEAKEHLRGGGVEELSMDDALGSPVCPGEQCYSKLGDMSCGIKPGRCHCVCHRPYPVGRELIRWMGDNDLLPPLIFVREANPLRRELMDREFKRFSASMQLRKVDVWFFHV